MPATRLGTKKGGAGKIVVMLSSVAKDAPSKTQSLLKIDPPANPSTAPATTEAPKPGTPASATPLPPQQVVPGKPQSVPPSKLSTTTYVKLPPKTSVPQLSSLSGLPIQTPEPVAPEVKPTMPTLPKKSAQHIPPIKLNEPVSEPGSPNESLLASQAKVSSPPPPAEPAPKITAPALLPPQRVLSAPKLTGPMGGIPAASTTPTKPTDAPSANPIHVAPPMLEKAPEPPPEKLPQPNIGVEARKGEVVTPPPGSPGIQKVPALTQPEISRDSLTPHAPPPKLTRTATAALAKAASWLRKSKPLILSSTAKLSPPEIAEAKPALKPPTLPKRALPNPDGPAAEPSKLPTESAKLPEKLAEKPATNLTEAKVAETKPALKPPTLPKRSQPNPEEAVIEPPKLPEPVKDEPVKAEPVKLPEKPAPMEKADVPAFATRLPIDIAPDVVPSTEISGAKAVEKTPPPITESKKPGDKPTPPVSASTTVKPPALPVVTKTADFKKPEAPTLPLTRVERAGKRRRWETILFYIFFVVTIAVLFWGALHFGRDTRVEGQIIPPTGMTLNNEVWIVTDFSSLASGVADDLAKERTPLLQEIQERQDHVQRAQADVASREERIRLITQQMNGAKDEINGVIKQSRDATQQVWDVEGAQLDEEYTSSLNQFEKTISTRAKSLNLNYAPDETFKSPEVWANAYRLALYQVPTGVDNVKELQWLGDQMKVWRAFQKTLDDKKEELREKAAQLKLSPAPRITDLNAKMDELQQRIDGTQAEEVPLKAELQQAQVDLAAAQSALAGLDDKYYKQIDSLPEENITKHIPMKTNGRFTWVEDDSFAEGEKARHYWIFSRATRPDGRQYWSLHNFSIGLYQTVELEIEPSGFVSTKAILRPDLTPEEQEQ